MSLKIESHPLFLHQSKNKESLSNSKTDKKASAVASQTLATWYTDLPPNGKRSVITKLPPEMVSVISSTFHQGAKPTLFSSNTTHLSSASGHSEIDKTKRGPDDLSVARNVLKPTDKKTPPKPSPRSHTTCLSSTSERSNIEKVPFTRNGNPSVITKLPSEMVSVISSTFHQGAKPTLFSSNTIHLSSASGCSETDKTERGSDGLSVARNILKSTDKKTPPTPLPRSNTTCLSPIPECSHTEKTPAKNIPPLPPPQKNKPKFKPVSVATPTSPLERRVSFQIQAAEDLETNASKTPNTSIKSILKQISSFNNTDIESKEALPKEKLTDDWADVDKIFRECFEYLNEPSSS